MDLIDEAMKLAAEMANQNKATEEKPKEEIIEKPKTDTEPKGLDLTSDMVFEYFDKNNEPFFQYLSKKAGKDVKSLDDLKVVETIEKTVEKERVLPDDVKQFLDFKLETGNGLKEFLEINRDWGKESEKAVVMEYMRQTKKLDGEELEEVYNLKYNPEEGELTDREMKLLKADLKEQYRIARDYLEQQKEKFKLPNQEVNRQREASEQDKERTRLFSENLMKAASNVKELDIDGFKYAIDESESIKELYQSLDSILKLHTKDGVVDLHSLVSTHEKGRRASQIAKAYAEKVKADYIEEQMKKMVNPSSPNLSIEGNGGANVQEFINKVFNP